ncbi:hypothetical protein ACR776_03220 [Sphingobacterium spiritivorum]|uniref:hypothetical protein n=1 Tax=Sphingobacterium spiritivorum TaxID=258 RepID=UPI003DA53686
MKNKIIILLTLIFGLKTGIFAQVYISKTEKPITEIVNSTHLTTENRISYDNAYAHLNNLNYRSFNKSTFAGEYFRYDNLIIQLVVITQKNAIYFKPLPEVRNWYRQMVSGGEERPIQEYFTDYINSIGDHKAYVNYFKDVGNTVSLVIQDNSDRYVISGTVYHSNADKTKAINFVNTLINSLSFK